VNRLQAAVTVGPPDELAREAIGHIGDVWARLPRTGRAGGRPVQVKSQVPGTTTFRQLLPPSVVRHKEPPLTLDQPSIHPTFRPLSVQPSSGGGSMS
jgi:hypothetical protein